MRVTVESKFLRNNNIGYIEVVKQYPSAKNRLIVLARYFWYRVLGLFFTLYLVCFTIYPLIFLFFVVMGMSMLGELLKQEGAITDLDDLALHLN